MYLEYSESYEMKPNNQQLYIHDKKYIHFASLDISGGCETRDSAQVALTTSLLSEVGMVLDSASTMTSYVHVHFWLVNVEIAT